MKKFLSFVSALLLLSAAAFAEVTVKKLSDGKVEVTFFYGNPRAQEVVIAGDFTNWQNGALPMTKGDKGWTFVTTVPAGTVMKYKFISDGNWTPDIKAPDTIDDGFGGLNGLADIDAMVAAATPAAGAAPVAKKGSNLKFATWSMLGYQTAWGDGKDAANMGEVQASGVNLTSYLKVSGEALPNMPIYIELALAEQKGFDNLYKKGSLALADGAKNLLVDTVFDPIYYYGGQTAAASYLGHLKLGLDTPYVNFVTGYKYAKLPPHTNVNWITVDKEWEAGYNQVGGYSQFEFAPLLRTLLADTGVDANVVVAPNRAADRAGSQYGIYSYGNAKFNIGDFSQYVDFQYNGAFGTTFDNVFENIMEDDFILGYQGVFGPVTAKVNGLYNKYGSFDNGDGTKTTYAPATSDVGMVDDADSVFVDNAATNANIAFASDIVNATVGYRMRGVQANMMYIEEGADSHTDLSDQLGTVNTQRIFADVSGTFVDKAITVGVAPYYEMTLNKDKKLPFAKDDSAKILIQPYCAIDLGPLADFTAKINAYGKVYYMTNEADQYVRGTDKSQVCFEQAGLKYDQTIDSEAVKEVIGTICFDNRNVSYKFISLTADATVPLDITAQIGCGYRMKNTGVTADPVTPFGFFVGAKKKISVLYKPTAYIQYMYGMDPYAEFNDGPTGYRLDSGDYTFKDGVTDYDGKAAIRFGLQWDL